MLALADRHVVIIGMRRNAARLRGVQQGDQSGPGFFLRECLQPGKRLVVVEVRNMRARRHAFIIDRRVVGPQAKRRMQCPLVGFGGGVQLVDRRRKRE